MNKKVIIDTEEIRNRFKNKFEHATKGMEHKHHRRFSMENEVKLFTNKDEMVTYVNGLTQIQNVEIFKIEDELYYVLVARLRKEEEHECCKDNVEDHSKETNKEDTSTYKSKINTYMRKLNIQFPFFIDIP